MSNEHLNEKELSPIESSGGRFDPFRLLSREERMRHLAAYRRHLEHKNGEIDLVARTLSNRESIMGAIASRPIEGADVCDREGFEEHLVGDGRTEIDEATAWLVSVAKANEGEHYGVNLELQRFIRDKRFMRDRQYIENDDDGTDMVQLYVFMEELYHSQILGEVCKACGLDLEIQQPRWRIRTLSRLIYHMPDRIRWMVILCAEIVGATAFKLFLDRTTVFAKDPRVEKRVRSLVGQIWRDELLHVAMLRARMGPIAIRGARLLFPFVVRNLIQDVPELLRLGGTRGEFLERVGRGIEIPADIDWMEPDLPASV